LVLAVAVAAAAGERASVAATGPWQQQCVSSGGASRSRTWRASFEHRGSGVTPYDDRSAEHFARTLLMPEAAWRGAAGYSNVELAEAFNVPLEQVVRRRAELARAGWWQLAPEAA
jgi:hypothetical protein